MTPLDHQHEQLLRAQVKTKDPAAEAILADFYEEREQPPRAALWRNQRRFHGAHAPPADLLVHDPKWRRKVMIWLVGHVIGPAAAARAFKSSHNRTLLEHAVTAKICLAANVERHRPTLAATQRLQAAGALQKPFEWKAFELGEVPPESWPVTRTAQQKASARKLFTIEGRRLALIHETDKRFAAATGYRPGHKLDPSDPQDAKMIPIWIDIYNQAEAERAERAERVRSPASTQHFVCRACSTAHVHWSARCPSCLSLVGLDYRSAP